MSGVIGKGNRSYIKQATGDSLLPDFNVTSLLWVHEITAAEVAGRAVGATFRIDFSTLNFPTSNELRQNGLTNPTSTRILALGIGNHRTNLSIKTSLKRELIDFLSYEADDTGITLDADVSIVEGESWIFTFDQNVQTGNRVVNARPLRKTAIVPSQRRRVAIGSTIPVAPSILNADGIDEQQIGNVQVFAEGKLLFRNPGNAEGDILTSGNYREVFLSNTTDSGIETATITLNGTANAIELNTALTQEADVMIISTNLIVDSETNTISTLTNSAATKLAELPTLVGSNAGNFLQVNNSGDGYDLSAGTGTSGSFPLLQGFTQSTEEQGPPALNTDAGQNGVSVLRQWTCPSDVETIFVEMAGAGGSGRTDNSTGGPAGSYWQGWLKVVSGQTYLIELGQGGDRANNTGGNRDGSRSRFEGSINDNAGAFIDCGATSALTPGNTTASPVSLLGKDLIAFGGNNDLVHIFAFAYSNSNMNAWNVDGVWRNPGSGVTGGSTVVGGGGSGGIVGTIDGGGGGGWGGGEQGGGGPGGRGGSGGSGGMRISWYTENAASSSTNFPITTR